MWLTGSDLSGSLVLNYVLSQSQNISLIKGFVTLNVSVLQLINAIGFEVSVLYNECMYLSDCTAIDI